MTETPIVKLRPHPCRTFWGKMVLVSIFRSEKNQLQIGRKKNGKIHIFSSFYLPEKTRAKKLDVTFSLKRGIHNPRTKYETMNSVFGLGHEI